MKIPCMKWIWLENIIKRSKWVKLIYVYIITIKTVNSFLHVYTIVYVYITNGDIYIHTYLNYWSIGPFRSSKLMWIAWHYINHDWISDATMYLTSNNMFILSLIFISLNQVNLNKVQWTYIILHMETSEPKWVNPTLNIIGVNSLRLGSLHI